MHSFFTRGRIIAIAVVVVLVVFGGLFFWYAMTHKQQMAIGGLAMFTKVTDLLPIAPDTKKEIDTVNTLVSAFTTTDGQTHTFLLM